MNTQCPSCQQSVPHHFEAHGLKMCLTCQSIKSHLSNHMKPEGKEKSRSEKCVVCSQSIPVGLPRSVLCEDCLQVVETHNGNTYFHTYRNFTQPWLIKSGGLVLGPLSTEQVEEKLRNKEIGLFDLVQKPYGRWIYAREEEAFKDVVEEVRSRPSSREDTVALTATDITEVEGVRMGDDTMSTARTVEALEASDQAPSNTYGVETPVSNFRSFVFFSLLFVLVGVGIAVVTMNSSSSLSEDEYRTTLLSAKNMYAAGDYKNSRVNYVKANDYKILDVENSLNFASILVGQDLLAEADQLLTRLALQSLTPQERADLNALKGLRNLNGGDLAVAEDALKTALEFDRTNEAAVFNMANIRLLNNQADEALDILDTIEKPTKSNIWKLLIAESAATKIKSNMNSEGISKIIEKVGPTIMPNPFAAETNLVLAYIYAKTGSPQVAASTVEMLLSAEPEVTEKSVEDLWLFRKRVSWQHLETYCSEMREILVDKNLAAMLWAYCQSRVGNTAEAKASAQEVYLKRESHVLSRALYAYAELKVGKHDQAESILKAREFTLPLEVWVMAKSCEALNNVDCHQANVLKLFELSPQSPYALSELARTSFDKKDKPEMIKWIEQGRERAWYYQPIRQTELESRSL